MTLTGELTLTGKVLAIGGLKEKVLAAHRALVKDIIIPKDNEKDLQDIPENVRKDLTFHPVGNIDEVLPLVFEKKHKTGKKTTTPKATSKSSKKRPPAKRPSVATLN